jgi:hypothetical protein
MADQPENKVVDKRVAHRYVRKGIVDEKDYEKYVKGLPDLADRAAPVEASIEGDDLDDDEGEGDAQP